MGSHLDAADFAHREYLSTHQCARLFGRGEQWWALAFDRGDVEGYRDGGKRKRFIRASSAREYLTRVGEQQRAAAAIDCVAAARLAMIQFRQWAAQQAEG